VIGRVALVTGSVRVSLSAYLRGFLVPSIPTLGLTRTFPFERYIPLPWLLKGHPAPAAFAVGPAQRRPQR
jgi:hypothetical protein